MHVDEKVVRGNGLGSEPVEVFRLAMPELKRKRGAAGEVRAPSSSDLRASPEGGLLPSRKSFPMSGQRFSQIRAPSLPDCHRLATFAEIHGLICATVRPLPLRSEIHRRISSGANLRRSQLRCLVSP